MCISVCVSLSYLLVVSILDPTELSDDLGSQSGAKSMCGREIEEREGGGCGSEIGWRGLR